jgi:AcrR family transcriptional regulator
MSEPEKAPRATRPKRRKQEDRSEATRQRLIDATLSCLETEGYAGTTISKIVERGAVSRGSHVYHFPSKAALIEAAASQLVRRFYVRLGKAFIVEDDADDRLRTIALSSWRTVFLAPEHAVLLELLLASRHEEELAAVMLRLWTHGYALVTHAAEHYFEPVDPKISVASVMALLQWQLRAMALDRHLIKDERLFEEHLEIWCDLLRAHIRPRRGVSSPPPKPPQWELK